MNHWCGINAIGSEIYLLGSTTNDFILSSELEDWYQNDKLMDIESQWVY